MIGVGLNKGIVDSPFWTTLKYIQYPGSQGETNHPSSGGAVLLWNTLSGDSLYPLTGMDAMPTFYIREDGYYNLYLQVRHPGIIVGFGNGFTGDGSGMAWIRTNRYGDEAHVGWAGNSGDGPPGDNNWMFCGPIKRYLLYGDYVQFWTHGEATGAAPKDWDASATITRQRS